MKLNYINTELQPKMYRNKKGNLKGNIFYFHGGGFLFGSKEDLPQYHIDRITQAGYDIYSFDYPLAPETKFPEIVASTMGCIEAYAKKVAKPYFLWGRSAGAYLCLLIASKGLGRKPKGIVSYYGYGFLTLDWYDKPNDFYLQYPPVDKDLAESLINENVVYSYPVHPRFLLYLYSRQKGNWLEYIWDGSKEEFLKEYSLKDSDFNHYPPVLLAHGIGDNDVPYEESKKLSERIKNSKFISFNADIHDFDRDESDKNTKELLDRTIKFLDDIIEK